MKRINKKRIIEAIISTICAAFLLWVGASYVDTITHNTRLDEKYGDYASWNFFSWMLELD